MSESEVTPYFPELLHLYVCKMNTSDRVWYHKHRKCKNMDEVFKRSNIAILTHAAEPHKYKEKQN